MTEFSLSLDRVIAYVRALHPDGDPVDHVAGAFMVSAQLDEQSDALIGYFIDQARRSGASWSRIGAAMGVSKQAAQKRFVSARPHIWSGAEFGGSGSTNTSPRAEMFSRFTDRARNVLLAARRIGMADQPESADDASAAAAYPDAVSISPSAPGIHAGYLAAALLAEPEGLAAKVILRAGLTADQVYFAVSAGPATPGPDAGTEDLRELSFDESGMAVLKAALKAALRLGHKYVGTEHLLLGVLYAGGPAAEALTGAGLTPQTAERLLAAEFADIKASRKAGGKR
jgi:Clp amino terminal domain, pathogenicity island component